MTGMTDRPTIGDLLRLKIVSRDELQAAVDGYIADPKPGWREIAGGVGIDIAAAVNADAHTKQLMRWSDVPLATREMALRTAILMAKPEGMWRTRLPRPRGIARVVSAMPQMQEDLWPSRAERRLSMQSGAQQDRNPPPGVLLPDHR
ncbi:hypothetical protein [Methylobacterium nodulans]|uniref:Uncharacterized protein n=1 Tax=Methylobacterium nodulans (strain LMG 21967 / CNCM I-2342 / ORS 2060) TaxID=460265 RepID=B8IDK5_METNO|nr:hypothetical protein [Methylobacterium nodulans]ACL55577.1 hypothetical protein Mnod_0539 [Methylobacterium nodulans ORS 2060]